MGPGGIRLCVLENTFFLCSIEGDPLRQRKGGVDSFLVSGRFVVAFTVVFRRRNPVYEQPL